MFSAGVGIIVMGLGMLGLVRMPWMNRVWRPAITGGWRGQKGAFPLGMTFAFGWVPCVGPALATIVATAASTQTAPWSLCCWPSTSWVLIFPSSP